MKDKVYKRTHVNWVQYIKDQPDFDLQVAFMTYCDSHPRMSKNRCAYYVLKSYCSTATIRALRAVGADYSAFVRIVTTGWL